MPKSKPHAGRGADAAFARAMARSAFGRFYTDDSDLQEVRRSLARTRTQRERFQPPHPKTDNRQKHAKPAHNGKLWRPVGVRERRTEPKAGLARLKEGREPPS